MENVREIRATNQEERYLKSLNRKIDEHERIMIRGELGTGVFVNASSVIMRLGVATTILTGAGLTLSGEIDFMLLFLFLLVITRVYAPFDQSLALIAEMFVSQVSANRIMELYDTPIAEGANHFHPNGHDIVSNMCILLITSIPLKAKERLARTVAGKKYSMMSALPQRRGSNRLSRSFRLREKHMRQTCRQTLGRHRRQDSCGWRGHLESGPGSAAYRLLHGVSGCCAL